MNHFWTILIFSEKHRSIFIEPWKARGIWEDFYWVTNYLKALPIIKFEGYRVWTREASLKLSRNFTILLINKKIDPNWKTRLLVTLFPSIISKRRAPSHRVPVSTVDISKEKSKNFFWRKSFYWKVSHWKPANSFPRRIVTVSRGLSRIIADQDV